MGRLSSVLYKERKGIPEETDDDDITTSDDECRALCRVRG